MVGVIFIAVILSIVALYLLTSYPSARTVPENQTVEENQPASENIEDILLTKIAAEKGIAKENVKICFTNPTENDNILAVGAISRVGGAIAFFYDNSLHSITSKEVDYVTTTNEEFQALSIVVGKISPWTGNEIVPDSFTEQDNSYTFAYYDGYSTFLPRWMGGVASVYLDNEEVEWGPRFLP